VEIDSTSKILSLDLRREGKWINAGAYLIQSSEVVKSELIGEESFEEDLLPQAIQNERVYGFVAEDVEFLDIGVPRDYHKAKTFFLGRK
jgi:NDP-sugar pyrophosphorylase family protein